MKVIVPRACRTLPEVPGSFLPLSGQEPEPSGVQPAWVWKLVLFFRARGAVSSRQPSLPVVPAGPDGLASPERAETAAGPVKRQASFSKPAALAAVAASAAALLSTG